MSSPMASDRVVNGVSSFTPVKIHLNYPSVVKPQGHAYICLYLAITITSTYNRARTCTDAKVLVYAMSCVYTLSHIWQNHTIAVVTYGLAFRYHVLQSVSPILSKVFTECSVVVIYSSYGLS